jgi:hypothetical protein
MLRSLLLALSFAVLLTGCNKVTQDNFSKIQDGMTMEQVSAIIGAPTKTESVGVGPLSGTTAEWINGDNTISIQFLNKQVRLKSFK